MQKLNWNGKFEHEDPKSWAPLRLYRISGKIRNG